MLGISELTVACPAWLTTLTENWLVVPNLQLKTPEPQGTVAQELEKLETLLEQGAIDGFVFPLSQLPFYTDGISVTALSERQQQGIELWQNYPTADPDQPLGISSEATLYFLDAPTAQIAGKLFPDHQIEHVDGDLSLLISKWQEDAPVIIGVDSAFAKAFDGSRAARKVKTQPQELVPAAGANVLAIVCKSANVEFRRAVKPYHHRPTGFATNVERSIVKLVPGNAYCFQDIATNYHAVMVATGAQLQIGKFSSSTHFNLAQSTIDALRPW